MYRERQQTEVLTSTKSPSDSAIARDESTPLLDILQEMLPESDEQIREALEGHRTEGQGE